MSSRRALLVESWLAGSHGSWAHGVVGNSRHEVDLVSHPGEFWRWRMRGSPLTLAKAIADHVERVGPPDVLLVSGLTDIAALLGLARRSIGNVPTVAYLHENQLTMPHPGRDPGDEMAHRSWLGLVAADRILINSQHHRDELFAALPRFLERAPDLAHTPWLDAVTARTHVVPVGTDAAALIRMSRSDPTGPPVVVWPHRFEQDKNPEPVFRVLRRLAAAGVAFRVVVTEEASLSAARRQALLVGLGDRVTVTGRLPDAAYHELLAGADVIASAAHHEYFGVAVVEAIAAGVVPVLPDRLSYPEIVLPEHHAAVLYPDGELGVRLAAVLGDIGAARRRIAGLRETMVRYDWSVVAPLLDDHLDAVAAEYGRRS